MAVWKVSPEKITLFEHPNADKLLVARVGMFPLVVGKDNGYEDDQIVIFAPKRSVLPEWLRPHYMNEETGISYLKDGTTVKSIRLRGQLSEGCTISPETVIELLNKNNESGEFPHLVGKNLEDLVGEDISEFLGITQYIPPIPLSMSGDVENISHSQFSEHDVEGISIFVDEFSEGEEVIVEEKLHGSQLNFIRAEDMSASLSSKGMISRGFVIKESQGNIYWNSVYNTKLKEIVDTAFPGQFVQIMAEVIPCQKNFTYGQSEATLRIFRLEVDHVRINLPMIASLVDKKWVANDPNLQPLVDLWVPIIYLGPFDLVEINKVVKGMETVSGKSCNIKEGGVVQPIIPRNAENGGFPLLLKVINPKYKGEDDDDAFS